MVVRNVLLYAAIEISPRILYKCCIRGDLTTNAVSPLCPPDYRRAAVPCPENQQADQCG
jgi:hypothetical protein